ncbi:unnamed protein product [Prorocentrum cordatum]|uniref:cellulose 1,4-beta-cellobiosidase (non-reducing end) n=1 Tax=Prorocentrum cordatum TaxID=2364126 RepID=A0ABN9XEH8_9DINO|nr:unnamed protein product [Polarella glacialis]CAK0897421.1 unnamed protein product [Polarella glacialis]
MFRTSALVFVTRNPRMEAMLLQRSHMMTFLGLCCACLAPGVHSASPACPGEFTVPGYGSVQLVPTGWVGSSFVPVDVANGSTLVAHMDARAYFADECSAGKYDNEQYLALNLLGKVLGYSVDLSGAGCGCNAALYLTSMRQNTAPSQCSDYYCDANNVCGESCAEIDVQEANQLAWHSTLHAATDPSGVGGGYGGGDSWTGPRDWGSAEYGEGARCVDTARPFRVEAAFPVDDEGSLVAMEVTLSQPGKPCNVSVRLGSYAGMAELSRALEAGMTPIVSYWSATDMLWMDGKGADGKGPCAVDDIKACGATVAFHNFSVAPIGAVPAAIAGAVPTPAGTGGGSVDDRSECAETYEENCAGKQCCKSAGMQCYVKNEWWAACREACVPGSTDDRDPEWARAPWSCVALGPRAPTASSGANGINASRSRQHGKETAATGRVVVKAWAEDVLAEVEQGSEITLLVGGQEVRAEVMITGPANLGKHAFVE